MEIHTIYFGLIAERLNKTSETLSISEEDKLDLSHFFEKTYPVLKDIKYSIAINQTIANSITEKAEKAEIALLPPFAGG